WAEVGPKCPAADVSTDTHDPTGGVIAMRRSRVQVGSQSRRRTGQHLSTFLSAKQPRIPTIRQQLPEREPPQDPARRPKVRPEYHAPKPPTTYANAHPLPQQQPTPPSIQPAQQRNPTNTLRQNNHILHT
ncbi:hypothetical protein PtrEW4_011219, partial [Pyrenophora tritici-repentis]